MSSSASEGIPLRLRRDPAGGPVAPGKGQRPAPAAFVPHLPPPARTPRCGEGPQGGRVRGESLARMAVLALRRETGAGAGESSLGRRGLAWIRGDHFRGIKAGKAWPEMSKNVCYTFIAGNFFAYLGRGRASMAVSSGRVRRRQMLIAGQPWSSRG